jgi:hypothetical protein
MLRPEDGIIICREIVVALVPLLDFPNVFAVPVQRIVFGVYGSDRYSTKIVGMIQKVIFDCDVDVQIVNDVVHVFAFAFAFARVAGVLSRFLHNGFINQGATRKINCLALTSRMCRAPPDSIVLN